MADLDHRHVEPPYLRVMSSYGPPGGESSAAVWDFRLVRPNREQVPGPVNHSLEHFLGAYVRRKHPTIMNVAPMGCRTGLYVWTIGPWTIDALADVLASGLRAIGEAEAVPLANVIQCGCAHYHSLQGVKELAAQLLRHRAGWSDPGPDAHEVRERDLFLL
ncbi:S-ribosylhomocysteine lyase [Nocardia sp. CNY236]|uniref:S-ribosylhomocysteine lyase n=1 Tax=Nocardia sp. CNY236 TaxID=1169152 RepID=UPI0003FAF7A2|nr:S-ribosylhomocysteine lyase [Nocardia sp. CNY236]